MKNGKKPTRREKALMKKWKLISDDWLVVSVTDQDMTVVSRYTDMVRLIPEGLSNGRRR